MTDNRNEDESGWAPSVADKTSRAARSGSARPPHSSARILGFTIDPRRWAIPILRTSRLSLSIHLLTFLFAVVMVAGPNGPARLVLNGWAAAEIGLLALAGWLVALSFHELAHVVVRGSLVGRDNSRRHVGDVALAPFGNFAEQDSLERPIQDMTAALAGPIFSACVAAVSAAALLSRFGTFEVGEALRFLVNFDAAYARMNEAGRISDAWIFLWWVSGASLLLAALNLLPAPPLDGWTVAQSLARIRVGYWPAVGIAAFLGVLSASLVALVALAFDWSLLLALAGICAWCSWQELSRLTLAWEESQLTSDAAALSHRPRSRRSSRAADAQRRLETDLFGSPTSDSPADPAEPSAAKSSSSDAPAPAAADDDARVDAILDKIARLGLSSLTDSERASLHQATQRKRNPAE